MWMRHKGPSIIFLMLCIKMPTRFIDEKFYNVLCNFLHKLRHVQKCLLHNKVLKVTSATNKTISSGKFVNLEKGDCGSFWGTFWMGAELIKATFVLFYCTYALYGLVSWACFGPFLFVGAKMSIDLASRKWREKTWKKVGKAKDARSNEINAAFKNIKTLKLYAWSDIFTNRIIQRRDIEENLIKKGEAKNLLNHFFHNSIGGIMTPTIITMAYVLGVPLSMSTVFLAMNLIDWLNWPLHMLPHFMNNTKDSQRSMSRL